MQKKYWKNLKIFKTTNPEVIELKNCFTVQHSEWHATKFYNLKNRYEESTWSIII